MSSISEKPKKRKREFFDDLYRLDEEESALAHHLCQSLPSTSTVSSTSETVSSPGQNGTPGLSEQRLGQLKVRGTAPRKLFDGLNFYFVPDNDKNAARRWKIKKAQEYGATWVRAWSSNITHVIVDKDITQAQVLKHLQIPNFPSSVTVVIEDYPANCIQEGMILNPQRPRHRIKGFTNPILTARDATHVKKTDVEAKHATNAQFSEITDISNRSAREPVEQNFNQPHRPVALQNAGARRGQKISHVIGEFQKGIRGELIESSDALEDAIAEAKTMPSIPLDLDDGDSSSFASPSESDGEIDRRPSRKPVGHSETAPNQRFKCMHPSNENTTPPNLNPNHRTISILEQMCSYYTRTADHWRSLSYRRAITALQRQPNKIVSATSASLIPGIGSRLASKIEEIVHTDRLQRLEAAQLDDHDHLLQLFTGIYQVGFAQANVLIAKGYRTLEDLANHPEDLSPNQRIGLQRYVDFQQRIPRVEVEGLADIVRRALAQADPTLRAIIGGSYRRGATESGDIDLIITSRENNATTTLSDIRRTVLDTVLPRLRATGFIKASFTHTQSSKWHGACALPPSSLSSSSSKGNNSNSHSTSNTPPWRRIDLLFVPAAELGAALIYFTGNDIFNRSIRLLARKKGMRLNQRGLFEGAVRGGLGPGPGGRQKKATEGGRLVEGKDERRIFELLGVPWREPGERFC